eukprot:4394562-Alexandrium_andersonii.AAC.1
MSLLRCPDSLRLKPGSRVCAAYTCARARRKLFSSLAAACRRSQLAFPLPAIRASARRDDPAALP